MILRIKSQLEELIFNGDYLSGQPFKRGSLKADIRALITITNKDCVYTGYRPAHLIDGILTTGIHEYIDADCICNGEAFRSNSVLKIKSMCGKH